MMIYLDIPQSLISQPKSDWAIILLAVIIAIVTIAQLYYSWKRDGVLRETVDSTKNAIAATKVTMELIEKHLKVLADHYIEEVSDRQMNKLVDTGIEHLKLRIGVDVAKIMMHNNIRTVPEIEKKVVSYVKNAFEYFSLNMQMFKFKESPIQNYIPDKYYDHVREYCIMMVVKPRNTHEEGMNDLDALSSYMITKFAKMKTEMYKNIYDCKKTII